MSSDFRFSCHSKLECFNKCCKDVDLFLTPYDVLRMKNQLGISSKEVLEKYTGILIGESGLPVIFLEMKDDGKKSCPFVSANGCEIYEDRPALCRAFPLKPTISGNYKITNDPKCLGQQEGREWTLEDWKKEQGLGPYNELEELFHEVLHNKTVLKTSLQNDNILHMVFMVYDLDQFRRFVFESKFLDVFDIEGKTIEGVKKDEVELLKLALKWLKFGLVDRKSLKMKEDATGAK